jgi:Homogentisate 1,2-dioxygenase
MPFYQRLGDLPRKRHVVHRDNGTLLTEEVMGFEGFSGLESILYHLQSPCRVIELGEFEPIVREEWVPDAHAHRHFRTWDIPAGGDAVTGRRLLMWNNDVEISLARPTEEMESFFRNGEGDEVIFIHGGEPGRSSRSSATCRTSRATTSSSRAARRTASGRRESSATSSSRRRG